MKYHINYSGYLKNITQLNKKTNLLPNQVADFLTCTI